MVAAYSYMALVPIIQPPVIRLLTTKKERLIRMPYEQKSVSKTDEDSFSNSHDDRCGCGRACICERLSDF